MNSMSETIVLAYKTSNQLLAVAELAQHSTHHAKVKGLTPAPASGTEYGNENCPKKIYMTGQTNFKSVLKLNIQLE